MKVKFSMAHVFDKEEDFIFVTNIFIKATGRMMNDMVMVCLSLKRRKT